MLRAEGGKEEGVGVEKTRYVAIELPQGSRFLNLAGVTGQCWAFMAGKTKAGFSSRNSQAKVVITYRNLKGAKYAGEKRILLKL